MLLSVASKKERFTLLDLVEWPWKCHQHVFCLLFLSFSMTCCFFGPPTAIEPPQRDKVPCIFYWGQWAEHSPGASGCRGPLTYDQGKELAATADPLAVTLLPRLLEVQLICSCGHEIHQVTFNHRSLKGHRLNHLGLSYPLSTKISMCMQVFLYTGKPVKKRL